MNVAHYWAGVSSCFDEPRSSLFKSLSRWKVGLSLQVKKNVRHSIYYCWTVIWGAVRGIHHQAVLLEVMDVRIAKPITKTSPWANNLQDGGERHDQAPNQIRSFVLLTACITLLTNRGKVSTFWEWGEGDQFVSVDPFSSTWGGIWYLTWRALDVCLI